MGVFRPDKLSEDGWDLIHNLVSDSVVSSMINTIEELQNSTRNPSEQLLFTHGDPPAETPKLSTIMTQWLNPWRWKEYSTKSHCLFLKEILFGEKSSEWLLFQEILFMKQPGQGYFHWHQDMPFFPLDNPDGFTCWIALDNCNSSNGTLKIASRSHTGGSEGSINLYNGKSQDYRGFSFDTEGKTIIQPQLNSGDALLFHPYTFHASEPNNTAFPRRAWATVWFKKGVKWDTRNAPNHPVLGAVKDGTLVTGVI